MKPETKELMSIGKLKLVRESWCCGDVLELRHTEVQHDHYFSNEDVETDISVEDAKELVKHLQSFIEFIEGGKP